jgi:hypothetical protein
VSSPLDHGFVANLSRWKSAGIAPFPSSKAIRSVILTKEGPLAAATFRNAAAAPFVEIERSAGVARDSKSRARSNKWVETH